MCVRVSENMKHHCDNPINSILYFILNCLIVLIQTSRCVSETFLSGVRGYRYLCLHDVRASQDKYLTAVHRAPIAGDRFCAGLANKMVNSSSLSYNNHHLPRINPVLFYRCCPTGALTSTDWSSWHLSDIVESVPWSVTWFLVLSLIGCANLL